MNTRYIQIIVLIIFSLLLNSCENVEDVIDPPPPPTGNDTNSTWMYTSNSGETWFVYKLYFCDKLFGTSSFNLDPYSSVLAVGNNGMIISSLDGGGDWEVDTIGIMKLDLNDLAPTGINGTGVAVGNQGSILWSDVGGQTWSYITTPTSANLYSVAFDTLSGLGLAVGANEVILLTYDRGLSWSTISSVPSSQVIYKKVAFANSVIAVAVGYREDTGEPLIIRSDNGGQAWTNISAPGLSAAKLNGVSFLDSLNGVAVGTGGKILKTIDGGLNWELKNSGSTDDLYSVVFSTDVCMISGNKVILTSFDSGETWSVNRIDNANGILYCIFCLGPGNYFVSGD